MRYLDNLSRQELKEGILPWDFQPATPIPDSVRKNKKERDAWINAAGTMHHVYTGNRGVNPNLRISALRPDGSGNPALYTDAWAGDFDAKASLEFVLEMAKRLPYPPNRIEETLSGHWRYVWLLATTIKWACHEHYQHFMEHFEEICFRVSDGMIGFDRKAWEAPERLWTNGCKWHHVHDNPIPADVVHGWLLLESSKFNFNRRDMGLAIPMESLWPALVAQFPHLPDVWPGGKEGFVVGAQGPTFWVPESQSPKSAIVRDTGMQSYAAHAHKGFFPWADLVGAPFCKQHEAQHFGRAVEGIYFNGHSYYRQLPNFLWKSFNKADITTHLVVARGMSPTRRKGEKFTEIEQCFNHINDYQYIEGMAPFWAKPPGILQLPGSTVLNICASKILSPAPRLELGGK